MVRKPTFPSTLYWLSPTELAQTYRNRSSISSKKDIIHPSTSPDGDQVTLHTETKWEACACASTTELSTCRPSRINTLFQELMTCLTSFEEPRYFPNCICGPDTGR
ncbi:hypothetical protein CLOP_g4750 [Closterium sp. NIES-67]|nr:hypothetical protein CLOP_g4750 [Closterium sp. NIES-67]